MKNNLNNKDHSDLPKLLVILGPTATGKTRLAVELAVRFNGEIVSADSRQVYKGMDIGTGKDLSEYKVESIKFKVKEIRHHLIDVVNPKTEFNLAKYQKMAFRAIDDILQRGKLPILVGGTGLYLQAVVDNFALDKSRRADQKYRKKLEKKNLAELQAILKKENPVFFEKLNESDRKNKRRLVRYCEIAMTPPLVRVGLESQLPIGACPHEDKKKYSSLLIGIKFDKEKINERIYKRLIERLEKEDMVGEVERLHCEGVSWKRLESFGLEYKFIALYLQNKLEYDEMVEKLNIAIRQFARRQMTWFRRWERMGARIEWISLEESVNKIVENFVKK